MFWKKLIGDKYKFVAVTEIIDITNDRHLYGQRSFRFSLADGTTKEQTFEAADWRAWQEPIANGGIVVGDR